MMLYNMLYYSEISCIFVLVLIIKTTAMKAILINPENQTIVEINLEKGIDAMYKELECDTFAAPICYDNGDTMYCDDEGLLKPQTGGILMPNWSYMILGKVLIVGCDVENGESKDVETPIEFFKKNIIWQDTAQVEIYQSHFI